MREVALDHQRRPSRRLLDPETARQRILARCSPLPAERVSLLDALGRRLARDVPALRPNPPADTAAMDGYAVKAADIAGASAATPHRLRLIGSSRAGRPTELSVGPGEAVRIGTGALLPQGADAVVVQELVLCRRAGSRARSIRVCAEVLPGANVRRAAEEWTTGDVLLPAGAAVTPAAIGVIATGGAVEVSVHRRPRVAVVVTGDELASAEDAFGRAELVVGSNGEMLEAYCRAAGATVCCRARIGDDAEALARWLARATVEADVILSTGGSSVGQEDDIAEAWRLAGIRTAFWKVAMRPGTPLRFGYRTPDTESGRESARPVLAFALSGNPFAAANQFELFVRPALDVLGGGPGSDVPRLRLPLAWACRQRPGLVSFARGTVSDRGAGPQFHPTAGVGNATLRPAGPGLLGVLPPGAGELPAGALIDALAGPGALDGRIWQAVGSVPPVVSVRGRSGSGKTCLIEQLLPVLKREGLRVATVKHASHPPALDTPRKDSFRHAAAGASAVFLVGPGSAAAFLYEQVQDELWPWLAWLQGRADLVLVEGFSKAPVPAVEIEQAALADFKLQRQGCQGPAHWLIRRPAFPEGPVRYPDPLVEALAADLVQAIGWRPTGRGRRSGHAGTDSGKAARRRQEPQ